MRIGGALFVMLVACGPASEPAAVATTPPAPTKPYVPPPLRHCEALGVDWCNRAYGYDLDVIDQRALVGGEYEEHVYMCLAPHEGEHVTYRFWLRDVLTGDLDGDGTDEAVLIVDDIYFGCGDEGSHDLTRLVAYTVRDGVPARLAITEVERREDATFTVVDGRVVRTLTDGCVHRWKVDGRDLVPTNRLCTR